MKHFFTLIIFTLFLSSGLQAQLVIPNGKEKVSALSQFSSSSMNNLPLAYQPVVQRYPVMVRKDPQNGQTYALEGKMPAPLLHSYKGVHLVWQYLDHIKKPMGIKDPSSELNLLEEQTDEVGHQHYRFQQLYNGIPVYGATIGVHIDKQNTVRIMGRWLASPEIGEMNPRISLTEAELKAQDHLKTLTHWAPPSETNQHLVAHDLEGTHLAIIMLGSNQARLVYEVALYPNLKEHWTYFIDALDGSILKHHKTSCQFVAGLENTALSCSEAHKSEHHLAENILPPPPRTANAVDLLGVNRTINVFECGAEFYMTDVVRPMYSGDMSNCSDGDAVLQGAIVTLDAQGNSPENDNFQYDFVRSSNNTWNDRAAVSSHYNGGVAYEYFRTVHGRNSINGSGGNILSFYNITDANGNEVDNAFWNGAAMFYGNGDRAFTAPLSKALDVAGHEMTHGVIQTTANLVYENQPGALNESFADVFGVMMDRDDWELAEDVANSSIFPTGAMRSMRDPNNGGNAGNFYWQPKHMNEYQNLPNTPDNDNGGVHINSGIPNHAFYLFATNNAVGLERAERVYYRALTQYLQRSSQFIDCRLAVIQAANDLYDQSVADAAANAFAAVGIGQGTGTTTEVEFEENPGNAFILYSDLNLDNINYYRVSDGMSFNLSSNEHFSRPNITDDGSEITYIGPSREIFYMQLDWANGQILQDVSISVQGEEWRNAVFSRDGLRIAALEGGNDQTSWDNRVLIFDFVSGNSRFFEFYNPTYTQGLSTGNVRFADAMEWDYSGEWLMYDALTRIESGFGDDIEYWDIGFIKVWDNTTNTFGDGRIEKLFSGLPENTSIGNPTFAKTSPDVIAFDVIEGSNYAIQAANIQTGNTGTIWNQPGQELGYPSYTADDAAVVFHGKSGTQDAIGFVEVSQDRLNGGNNASALFLDAPWGIWFNTGDRDITVNNTEIEIQALEVFPNPSAGAFTVKVPQELIGYQIQVQDINGKSVFTEKVNQYVHEVGIDHLSAGIYWVRISNDQHIWQQKLVIE